MTAWPTTARADALDTLIRDVMAAEAVPGAAVAIVRKGQAPDLRSYGVRDLAAAAPVDARTRFGIASLTKAFTAVVAAQAVDRGLLGWDDKVSKILPDFAVADACVTAEVTLRDLLAHRTGTVRGDLLWFNHPGVRDHALIAAMRGLPQQDGFRSGFSYSNLMYTAAGTMVSSATGRSWQASVREDVLRPLGMADTLVGAAALAGQANVAGMHAFDGNSVRSFTLDHPYDNTQPAGGLYASARDMARWLAFWIAEGQAPDGTRLVSPEAFSEIITTQTVIRERGPLESFQYDAKADHGYAFGWFTGSYRGHRVLTHLGGGDGVAAMIAWMPDAGVGVAVMMNREGSLGRLAIRNAVLDSALGVKDEDRDRFAGLLASWQAHQQKTADDARKTHAPRPLSAAQLKAWPGDYHSAAFGTIAIRRQGGELTARLGDGAPIRLRPWGAERLQLLLENPAFSWPEPALIQFREVEGVAGLVFSASGQSGEYKRAAS
nr:serine hydrolase [Sphingosinicella soli]